MQDRSPPTRQNLLATHGRTIHWVTFDRFSRFCLPVHVRFGSKATDWPVVGQLTSFMSTRPGSLFASISTRPASMIPSTLFFKALRKRAVKALNLSGLCRPFWCHRVDVLRSGRHSSRFLSSEMRSSTVFVLCRRDGKGSGPSSIAPPDLSDAKVLNDRNQRSNLSTTAPPCGSFSMYLKQSSSCLVLKPK